MEEWSEADAFAWVKKACHVHTINKWSCMQQAGLYGQVENKLIWNPGTLGSYLISLYLSAGHVLWLSVL